MNPQAKYECWKSLEKQAPESLEYNMDYLKMCGAEDETLMAIVFKFANPLCEKLLNIAAKPTLPQIGMVQEVKVLCNMLNPTYCNIIKLELQRNNNVKIFV